MNIDLPEDEVLALACLALLRDVTPRVRGHLWPVPRKETRERFMTTFPSMAEKNSRRKPERMKAWPIPHTEDHA